jgi:hypothetical protein
MSADMDIILRKFKKKTSKNKCKAKTQAFD